MKHETCICDLQKGRHSICDDCPKKVRVGNDGFAFNEQSTIRPSDIGVPVNSSMSEKEAIPEWKDLLRQAADKFVTTHEDSEVRRMYGHHFRSFRDGAIWEHERVKGEPVVSQDQERDTFALDFAVYMHEDSWKYDHAEQKTHSFEEHLNYFKAVYK